MLAHRFQLQKGHILNGAVTDIAAKDLRTKWLTIIGIVILGAVILNEVYSYLVFPDINYNPKDLPTLQTGVSRYDFFKDNARVGSYLFSVDKLGQFNGQTAYFTSSHTSVLTGNVTIKLDTFYVFNDKLKPLEYRLNATVGDDRNSIICLFDGNFVNATLETRNNTINRRVELPENTVLIDSYMIGHWDLFYKSFDLIPDKRFLFNVFVPQLLDKERMEIFVDKNPQTININGIDYVCQVVRGTEQNIVFYISKGSVLRFEDTDQNVQITMLS